MSLEGHSRRFRLIRPVHGRSAAPPIPGIKLRPGDRRSVPEATVSNRSKTRLYSITSSARASSVVGTLRASVLAVLRLIASRYFVSACTGRSAVRCLCGAVSCHENNCPGPNWASPKSTSCDTLGCSQPYDTRLADDQDDQHDNPMSTLAANRATRRRFPACGLASPTHPVVSMVGRNGLGLGRGLDI